MTTLAMQTLMPASDTATGERFCPLLAIRSLRPPSGKPHLVGSRGLSASALCSSCRHEGRALANLADMIREARTNKGLSQYALADQIGVRNTAVSVWETGKVNPSPENMVALIDVLGLDPDEAAAAYLDAWRR